MISHKIDVIGVGSPIYDLIVNVSEDDIRRAGGDKGGMILVNDEEMAALQSFLPHATAYTPGGSAANTAFAMAHLGMTSSFLGKLGLDERGKEYAARLAQLQGDTSRFKYDAPHPTACCVSMVTPDSQRTMRTHLGAAQYLHPEEIITSDFAGCRLAHIEGYLLFNEDLLLAVLHAAKSAGCIVSLDLGAYEIVNAKRDLLHKILPEYVDVIFANEDEATAFCGSNNPIVCLTALAELCDTAVVKIGAQGAWVQVRGERLHIPANLVPDVKDTTGAGDLWAAGFLFGQLQGCTVATCGALGSLLAGHVIQHFGAALSDHLWEEVRSTANAIAAEGVYNVNV